MQPLLGLVLFIALAWILSLDRRAFPWRTVLCGLGLQFLLAYLILCTSPGKAFFASLDGAFSRLLGFANEGTAMGLEEAGQLLDQRLRNPAFRQDMDTLLRPGLPKFDVDMAATVVRTAFLSHLLAP